MKRTSIAGVVLAVVLMLSVELGEAAVPNCFHHWPKPKPTWGAVLPLEPCEKDTDCCGNQECRTYSGLGPLGDHAGYPDMTAIGKKRCVPRSWIHASPQSNDVMYAEGKNSSIWSLNLKPPMGWTCNDGTTRDWFMSRFCCAEDWARDIFPSSIGCGQPFCWANDITDTARTTCEARLSTINSVDACCTAADGSAKDRYTDPTTGSRCLVGFINYSPAKGSNEAWYGPVLKKCCRSTCRYLTPDSELWICLQLSDLGWTKLGHGKMVRRMLNPCNLQATRQTFGVFNCADL